MPPGRRGDTGATPWSFASQHRAIDAALDLAPEEFRRLGHALVDQIASFLASLPQRPVTPAASAEELRTVLPRGGPVEHVTTHCERGHWFTPAIESLDPTPTTAEASPIPVSVP